MLEHEGKDANFSEKGKNAKIGNFFTIFEKDTLMSAPMAHMKGL